jgi:hypothetical protein
MLAMRSSQRLLEYYGKRHLFTLKTIIKHWLLVAIIITGFSGLLEATVQQVIRQSADDPQIQMAEDTYANSSASSNWLSASCSGASMRGR